MQPVTAFTDLLLAVFCYRCFSFFLAHKLKWNFNADWKNFFLFLSISTFLGVLTHGLPWTHENFAYRVAWISMQVLSCIAMWFAQSGAAKDEIKSILVRNRFLLFCKIQLVLFILAVLYFQNFLVVSINSLLCILQLMVVYWPSSIRKLKYRGLLFMGFIISFSTLYIHVKKLTLFSWFNYNDLSHLIMLLSLLLIYRGIKWKSIEQIERPTIESDLVLIQQEASQEANRARF
jgi:hypothetical protein